MSTDKQLKHKGHVLYALHHLHRAAQLHEITGKEQLKFVDGQCPDIAGEPVVLFDQVAVDGVEAVEVSIPVLFGQCLFFGTQDGKALSLKDELITVEIVDGFIVFRIFVGRSTSNESARREREQGSNPGSNLEGGAV